LPAHDVQQVQRISGSITLASASWADLSASDLTIDVINPDGWFLLLLEGTIQSSGTNRHLFLDFLVGAARIGQTWGLMEKWSNVNGDRDLCCLVAFTHISQPSSTVTIRPQYKVTNPWVFYADSLYSPARFAVVALF